MKINNNLPSINLNVGGPPKDQKVGNDSFGDMIKNALSDVSDLQQQSDIAFEQLIHGEIEFHDAMIIAEKAGLALQLTMAIRNKLVDAYQEIMRMQV